MTTWRLGPYRALEHTFVVEGVGCSPVREPLESALAPLAAPDELDRPSSYSIRETGNTVRPQYRVAFERRRVGTGHGSAHAVGLVLWHVNQRAVITDRGRHLMLHAAAAERDGVLVLLLGESGVGKTTTVAGLLQAGFRYLTDEAVALDRETLSSQPFPKALALNADVLKLFRGTSTHDRAHEGESVQHLSWVDLGSPGVSDGLTPGLVVALTKGVEGRPTPGQAWPISPGEAVMALASSTFRFRQRPRQNLTAGAALTQSTPAVALSTGDLEASVTQIALWVQNIKADRQLQIICPRRSPASEGDKDQRGAAPASRMNRYSPTPGLTVTVVGDELLVRHPVSGNLSRLSGTARSIWDGLVEAAHLDPVVEQLSADFRVPRASIRRDVEAFVAELLQEDLVRADKPDRGGDLSHG